jgi:hypothetical protein
MEELDQTIKVEMDMLQQELADTQLETRMLNLTAPPTTKIGSTRQKGQMTRQTKVVKEDTC